MTVSFSETAPCIAFPEDPYLSRLFERPRRAAFLLIAEIWVVGLQASICGVPQDCRSCGRSGGRVFSNRRMSLKKSWSRRA